MEGRRSARSDELRRLGRSLEDLQDSVFDSRWPRQQLCSSVRMVGTWPPRLISDAVQSSARKNEDEACYTPCTVSLCPDQP